MTLIDKSSVLERAQRGETLHLELGCGPRKRRPQAIGVDMLDCPGVDLVGDVTEALDALPAASCSSIHSEHFFEHVADLPRLLQAVSRVLKPGGELTVIVPHFSNPFYYSDPTHRTPFGLYTLAYYCRQALFTRTIPDYGVATGLRLNHVSLGFKSYPPRYVRHAFKRLAGLVFNAGMYMREFYEENLCWLVPCYEVRYELERE